MGEFDPQSEVDAMWNEIATLRACVENLNKQLAALMTARPESETSPKPFQTKPVGTTFDLAGDGRFGLAIVSRSYRQHALRALAGNRRQRGEEVVFTAAIVPEPDDQDDSYVIRVCVRGGDQIGSFARTDAFGFRAVAGLLFHHHGVGLCRARLIGGTERKRTIGVQLDLAEPAVVLNALNCLLSGSLVSSGS